MKVILKEDVKKLGQKGAVVNVSDGYARNFLFTRKLAVPMTEENLRILEGEKKRNEKRERQLFDRAKVEAEKLSGMIFKIKAKSGEEGKLFGSVTSQDIADAIAEQSEFKIDKRDIRLEEHIKYLGKYKVKVKIHPKVTTEICFEVIKE